jgi:hypothetical protein
MTDDRDSKVLALQIGRPLRAASTVLRRCDLGLPIVAEVPPVLENGEPFPTRYWLSCPLVHRRVARIEARGGVREAQLQIQQDPELANAVEEAHARYARERDASVPIDARHRPRGGVGGSAGGVKCLHAHYADFAAGNENPLGRSVHREVGRPHCRTPCVAFIDGELRRNPNWREPANEDQAESQ